MSRTFDAKQSTLAAYPASKLAGVDHFLDFLNVSSDDFQYNEGMTATEYIYGTDPKETSKPEETTPANIFKLEVLVIDFNGLDEQGVKDAIENTNYIFPEVMKVECKRVDWTDDHPLNKNETSHQAYIDLFGASK